MTKQSGEEVVPGPDEDIGTQGSPKVVDMPDTENIQVAINKQFQTKCNRGMPKRQPFTRRMSTRKRSYSYSEGHSSHGANKRYKRGPKTPGAQGGTKFLFGGNINDPLNLNALSKDELDRRKSDSILQPKKFEGYSTRAALMAVTGKRWKRNNSSVNCEKKFLFGGNFRDPLNLNSLSDEKVAQVANAVTPASSPMPTPKHRKAEYKIEVLIPPNISDPLNLMSFDEDPTSPQSDFLSPEMHRLRRHLGKPNVIKFDNIDLTSGGQNKKVRFRKRAKSMVAGNISASDQAGLEMAAKIAMANKKQREADIAKLQADRQNGKDAEMKPKSESTEVETEKGKRETQVSDEESNNILPPPTKSPALAGSPKKTVTIVQPPKKDSKKTGKNHLFEYGNYNRYYGYRNPSSGIFPEVVEDVRLQHFRPEWFFGKDVLDIGCNVGSLTLEIGRRFAPKTLLGIDIDPGLIRIAKQYAENLKKYQVPSSAKATPVTSLSAGATPSSYQDSTSTFPLPSGSSAEPSKSQNCESLFPLCFPLLYGPLIPTGSLSGGGQSDKSTSAAATPHPYQQTQASVNSVGSTMSLFGRKVRFLCENYVFDSDELLDLAQPEFDTILCLSTTKWMHLNFGDDGMKRAFKRMYAQLRPGGMLVLEAQNFASYGLKRKMTPRILETYQSIQFRPEQFSDYLLHEVGFTTSHVVAIPRHPSRGFQRPIQVFTKMPLLSTRSFGESGSSQNTPYYCASCSCPATPYSSHTTPYHSCSGSCQATPHYYHHYSNVGSEGETPVHNSMQ